MLKSKTTHKLLAVVGLLVAAVSIAAPRGNQYSYFGLTKATPASSAIEMMASTVRLSVTVEYTRLLQENGQSVEQHATDEWTGSGVVYDKTSRENGPIRSRILSANHVLETPVVGSVEDDVIEFFGITIKRGERRVDSVKVELQTADGRICNVKVLALGSSDTHDTATAEADCDAGRVAKLASAVPVMGEKIFVSGYALGVPLPMLTEGYISGMFDGYLLTSVAAFGGNSGGPVYHNGRVIGLLVRGSREYPHLTLVVNLEDCLRRIAETPPL